MAEALTDAEAAILSAMLRNRERGAREQQLQRIVWCGNCDGCGWYEGGRYFIKTTCRECSGTGHAVGCRCKQPGCINRIPVSGASGRLAAPHGEAVMTPLTGMTASQAAQWLRRSTSEATFVVNISAEFRLHLASLLEQGARDTELVTGLLDALKAIREWLLDAKPVTRPDLWHPLFVKASDLANAAIAKADAARAGEKQP